MDGIRLTFTIGDIGVAQVTAGVSTSEPDLTLLENLGLVKIDNANRFALEPEFTITEYLEPIYLAKLISNFFTFFPIVTQLESNESIASLASAKP